MKFEIVALVALAGCGSDAPAKPDAGDAIDAAPLPPDAPTSGIATLQLGSNLGQVADVPVSIADASGTPTAMVMTDASGLASGTVVAGGSMTAFIDTAPDSAIFITVLDLHPGDHLKLGGPLAPAATARGTANVTYGVDPGVDGYSVGASTTCAVSTPPASTTAAVALDSTCVSGGNTYDLVAYAMTNGHPSAYQAQFDLVAPAASTTSTVGLGAWRTDFVELAVALANAPMATVMVTAAVAPRHNNITFRGDSAGKPLAPAAGVGFDLVIPKGSWNAYVYTVDIAETATTFSRMTRQPATVTGLVSVDLSTELLPFVHGLSADLPTGQTMPALHFTPDRALTAAAGMVAVIQYQTPGGTAQGLVAIPPSTTDVQMPSLPDSLSAFRPTAPFSGGFDELDVVGCAALWPDAKAFRETWSILLGEVIPPVGSTLLFSSAEP